MNELLQEFMALAQKAAAQGIKINTVTFSYLSWRQMDGRGLQVTDVRIDADAQKKTGGAE